MDMFSMERQKLVVKFPFESVWFEVRIAVADRRGCGGLTQPGNGFVVTDFGFDAGVGARCEQNRIAIAAELRIGVQCVQARVDRRDRIAWSKDVNVGASKIVLFCATAAPVPERSPMKPTQSDRKVVRSDFVALPAKQEPGTL